MRLPYLSPFTLGLVDIVLWASTLNWLAYNHQPGYLLVAIGVPTLMIEFRRSPWERYRCIPGSPHNSTACFSLRQRRRATGNDKCGMREYGRLPVGRRTLLHTDHHVACHRIILQRIGA